MTKSALHGVPLVEKAIDAVRKNKTGPYGITVPAPKPVPPDVLSRLVFPNGDPLSPSLKRWLEFDGSWLELFESPTNYKLRTRSFVPLVEESYEHKNVGLESFELVLHDWCFRLPFGEESTRFLYVGVADSMGEHPVLTMDAKHGQAYLCVGYPGIDVYLATHAGLIEGDESRGYEQYYEHPIYGERVREHIYNNLYDLPTLSEYVSLPSEFFDVIGRVPPQEGINPFTKQKQVFPARPIVQLRRPVDRLAMRAAFAKFSKDDDRV